jgi:hypothetical protein
MLSAGTYKAKIKDYGFTDPGDKKNDDGSPKMPQAMVQFEVDVPEGEGPMGAPAKTENITWFGSFSGGAKAITTKTLVDTFHFNGTSGEELYMGAGSGVLDETCEYELVVEMNEWNGKSRPKIKYVNRPGQVRRAEKLEQAGAKKFVGGLNLKAELASVRASMKAEGKDVPATKTTKAAPPKSTAIADQNKPPQIDESEEIPW